MQFSGVSSRISKHRKGLLNRFAHVLDHGQFILGPEVHEFEAKLSRRLSLGNDPIHALTCASGSDALRLALMALDIGPGQGVLLPAFGFAAAAEAIRLCGAFPVFVDIDAPTFNIDPHAARTQLLSWQAKHPKLKVTALIAIDTFGHPADYGALDALCREYGLYLIEDAAQSLGGTCHGRQAGTFGTLAITSFYPTKTLGGLGDGGAVFAKHPELARRLRALRDHGQSRRYHHVEPGLNSRLDTLQAAALLEVWPEFDGELALRRKISRRFGEVFLDLPPGQNWKDLLRLPQEVSGFTSSWSVYTVLHRRRDALQSLLQQKGIPTTIHYPKILPEMPAFQSAAQKPDDFPEALRVSRECLSLPIHGGLTERDIKDILAAMQSSLIELSGKVPVSVR